jgi:hypothetical protein
MCATRTCTAGKCGASYAAAGAMCGSDGAPRVCDGAGACLQCLTDANCRAGFKCIKNVCLGSG